MKPKLETVCFLMMKSFIFSILMFVAGVAAANAITINEARTLLDDDNVASALAAADSIATAQPKSADAQLLLGDCLRATGKLAAAETAYTAAKTKGNLDANLRLAELAADRYDLDRADELIDAYKKQLAKIRKNRPADRSGDVSERLSKLRTLLDRVESIAVIDSIIVDKDSFFDAYRLTPESGKLLSADVLPEEFPRADETVVYATEDSGQLIWGAVNDDGNVELVFTSAMNDGTWDTPAPVGSHLGLDGDANYPYMMPDGITLYFAADNDESIGGYDIFISRNNGDGFLQPQNLGFPYNSPYDDYMLAIDETTGVGWWATDRNQLPGQLTIYIFKTEQTRRNVDIDDPKLASKARLLSIADTWEPDADYSQYYNRINAIATDEITFDSPIEIPLPDGTMAYSLDDLPGGRAYDLAERYVRISESIAYINDQLAALYNAYAEGNRSVSSEIASLENQLKLQRANLQRAANDFARSIK